MSELKIIKQLVKDTPHKFGRSNRKRHVAIHQTGNTQVGANAKAHANIQTNGNPRAASWHWSVDDKYAIQSFTHDFQLYAAGDGRGPGNMDSIHIEICINRDGNYAQAVKNGAALARYICDQEGIPYASIRQHWDFSRKNCPAQIRANVAGISWSDFRSMVAGGAAPTVKPVASAAPAPGKATDYKGDSIVFYLDMIGKDSSFAARTKLAKQHGIIGYRGTASQNLQLLNKLRSAASKPAPKPAPAKTNGSIVDYLVSTGQSSSFANRAKLAKQYGIANYKGTAAQNTALLNKLVGGAKPAAKPKPVTFKVGQTVTVKKTAKTFATGQSIASHVKGKRYKIIQLKTDRALLDGIMSWVKKTDIQ